MPRKIAKEWKKHLATYYIIRKTIYVAKNNPQWQTHPILTEIRSHQYAQIPHPRVIDTIPNEWIDTIAAIAKNANKEARKITTKYTKDCIRKAISKYGQLYGKSSKK